MVDTSTRNTTADERIDGHSETDETIPRALLGIFKDDETLQKHSETAFFQQERIRETRAQLSSLKRKLREEETQLAETNKRITSIHLRMLDCLTTLGVSNALFGELRDFSNSFHEQGLGYVLNKHDSRYACYLDYDPTFCLFRRDIPCRFESSSENINFHYKIEHGTHFVHRTFVVKSDQEKTWGAQFPKLYRQAFRDAHGGSEAAKDILISLPDMNASSRGGWLFKFESLKVDGSKEERWVFQSAHNFLAPISKEEKHRQILLMLSAISAFNS